MLPRNAMLAYTACLSAPEVPLQLVWPHVYPVLQGGFIHAGLTSLWMKTNTLLIVSHIVNPWSQSYFSGPVDRKMVKTVVLGSCPSTQMSVWAWWPLPCVWSQLPLSFPAKRPLTWKPVLLVLTSVHGLLCSCGSAAGTASAFPGTAGVAAEWPAEPACSEAKAQTGFDSGVGDGAVCGYL